MTAAVDPRIIGTGYAVPPGIRTNDDPIFDWLKANDPNYGKYFNGYRDRHYLTPPDTVTDLMMAAAQRALRQAGLDASRIDLLIGDASVSEYLLPNAISGLHHRLGLAPHVLPVALTSGFSQFNVAMMMADALIRAGRATYVLIALGDNWTQFVDYHTPQSTSAGDGAAACVIGPARSSSDWSFVDSRTIADTSYYGSMYMAPDPVSPGSSDYGRPVFQITDKGAQGFLDFGYNTAWTAATDLLLAHPEISRNAQGQWTDVCLITHQASAVLVDHWQKMINPGTIVQTIEKFANMVQCSVPLNLAYATENPQPCKFTQNYLLTLSLGPDMHANATLFRRNF
ncbi:MAG: hypothetical protein RLZZ413_2282 [Pseudomonadota bacterium]